MVAPSLSPEWFPTVTYSSCALDAHNLFPEIREGEEIVEAATFY